MAEPESKRRPRVAFLVGSVRSGTTLFRLMLEQHPQVAWLPECDFLFTQISPGGERPEMEAYKEFLRLDRIFVDCRLTPDFSSGDYDRVVTSCLEQISREQTRIVGGNLHYHFARSHFVFPDA